MMCVGAGAPLQCFPFRCGLQVKALAGSSVVVMYRLSPAANNCSNILCERLRVGISLLMGVCPALLVHVYAAASGLISGGLHSVL